MSLPNTPRSYDDCYQALDAALEDDSGIRIKMESVDAAIYFRMRCHKARAIDRKNNAQTYERGNPLHGCSAYDCLVLRTPHTEKGQVYLYIEKQDEVPGTIEFLSNLEDEEDETPQPIRRV